MSSTNDTHESKIITAEDIKRSSGDDVERFIAAARRHEANAGEDFRRDIYSEVWRLGLASSSHQSRQAAVDYLIARAQEHPGFLADLTLRLALSFRKADFSDAAAARLEAMAQAGVSARLARVVGVAEATKTIPLLQRSMAAGFAEHTAALRVDAAWNAALALARMGEPESQRRIRERVLAEEDIVLRATLMFPDLGYTKTQASFDLLREYFDSEQRLPTLKPTQAQGEREAAHAAKTILVHVEGPPDVRGLDDDRLVQAVAAWAQKQQSWPIWR